MLLEKRPKNSIVNLFILGMSWISSKFGTIYIVNRLTGVLIFLDNLTFYHVYITVIKSSHLLCVYKPTIRSYIQHLNLLLLFSLLISGGQENFIFYHKFFWTAYLYGEWNEVYSNMGRGGTFIISSDSAEATIEKQFSA